MRQTAEAPDRLLQPEAPAYRRAVELTDDIVYELDCSLQQLYLNPSGHRVLGLEPGAGEAKSILPFFHEEDRFRVRLEIEKLLRTGEDIADLDARMVSICGQVTQLTHRLQAVRSAGGALAGILGIGRDVSALRRAEEQLQQSQKLETIGLLAGGIAHDFNNMLAAILGYTELMLEEKDPSDPDYRALSYINTSTERAAALVKQILVFSRRSTAQLIPIRLGAVVEETLRILTHTLPKTIRIAAQLGEQNDRTLADPVRLQQAVMNICLNARDAMPNGGELRVEIDRATVEAPTEAGHTDIRPGDYLRLRVQDTGQGMPPEVLDQIWDPFFTTKESGEGTGLGLSVVNGIVRAHRGHVQVESQVGRGTTFFLYLPSSSDPDLEASQATPEPPGGSETILVVDDEPVLLDLLFDILSPKGYHVIAAEAWDQALDYVDSVGDRIDLVITDNMMPGMTGRQLAREISSRQPRIKILVCSGYSPTRESELGELDYVDSYLQKPYQRRDLLARVRETLDSPPDEAS